MGCSCTRGEGEETTRLQIGVGNDYQEIQGQTSGEGIKQTVAWQATITQAQLQAKREEFWRTQTSGRRSVWLAIRQAVEADPATAATLLQLAEVTLERNNLAVCLDRQGNRYELPPFMINDPVKFSDGEPKRKGRKKKEMKESVIKIKLRNMTSQAETEIEINNSKEIKELKRLYAEALANISVEQIRLFFGGKELKDDATIASYYISNAMVIQSLVKPNVS